jgi:predicted HicB family RNase H-like nuclease
MSPMLVPVYQDGKVIAQRLISRVNEEQEKMGGVPNKPKTPHRTFRIEDELYDAVKAKAAERGESVTDVVTDSFRRYLKRK